MIDRTRPRSAADLLGLPPLRGRGGLIAAIAVDSVGTGLFLPFTVVYFLTTTTLSLPVIGAALTAARLLAIPSTMLVGPLIDRFGARRLLAAGNLLGAAAFAGYLVVGSVWQLVAAAFLAAASHAAFWTSSRALIVDIAGRPERPAWFALVSMTRNAGYGLGGVAAAVAVGVGMPWVYRALAGVNALSYLLAAGLVLRWRPPGRTGAAPAGAGPGRPGPGGYRALLRDRALLLVTTTNLAYVMCANVLPVLLVVYVVVSLGQPAWLGGVLFTVNTVLVSTAQTATTRSVRRVGHVRVLQAAAACWGASFMLLWALAAAPRPVLVPGLVLAVVVFTVAEMLHGPVINTLAVDIAPPEAAGRYAAAFQLSWSLGSAVAPLLLTWLISRGVALTWLALVGACALAAAGVRYTARSARSAGPAQPLP